MPAIHPVRRLAGASLLAAAILSAGCATTAAPPPPQLAEASVSEPAPSAPELIPVVRYGRYTLVELAPDAAQRDLLLQVIDVAMPEDVSATVGDGLRHALRRSGYRLCETAHTVIELYALPLPAAHLRLGPLTLRDALLTLAGPAWDLHVDDRARQVCFARADEQQEASPDNDPVHEPAQIFPLAPRAEEGEQP